MSAPASHISAAVDTLRPPPALDVDEWADRYRMLSREEAAEPGNWDTSRTPYMREVLEVLSVGHPATDVTLMKGAQVGGSEAGLNFLGYIMDHAPGPAMVVMPTEDTARDWSRDRLGAMIRSTPQLSALFGDKSRDPDNSISRKKFPGGFIKVAHATSGSQLRSKPIRYLVLDEIDGYPLDVGSGEGGPCDLAERRTSTFGATKKIFRLSTPTTKQTSRIARAYEASDQRRYYVPCPHCDHYQTLRWEQMHWVDDDPGAAGYVCEDCGCVLEESDKTEMLERGEWRAENDDAPEGVVGFHLSSLYSPDGWLSWQECVRKHVKAKADKTGGAMRTFTNTVLGFPSEKQGDRPDWEKIYLRREGYDQGTVPDEAMALTAGVDVQGDRLEVEVVGWGRGLESWSVDYRVIQGDPSGQKVWKELAALFARQWPHESGGTLQIRRMFIDSGYKTQEVYRFCRQYHPTSVCAVKGKDRQATPISRPRQVDQNRSGKKSRTGATLILVGADSLKRELYGWLGQPLPEDDNEGVPDGWCHFPQYGQEFFRQLCAEQEVIRTRRGRPVYCFEKVRDRNEALDCRIYARAASIAEGIDRWKDKQWNKIRDALTGKDKPSDKRDRGRRYSKAERDRRGRRKGSYSYE